MTSFSRLNDFNISDETLSPAKPLDPEFNDILHHLFYVPEDTALIDNVEFTTFLEYATQSQVRLEMARDLPPEATATAMTMLQLWLDKNLDHPLRFRAIYILVKLAAKLDTIPQSLFVSDITLEHVEAVDAGRFGDIYSGFLSDGTKVAIKQIRWSAKDKNPERKAEMHKQICREVFVWRQLRHPNIASFIGVSNIKASSPSGLPCFVSPWMEHGSLWDFLDGVGPDNAVRERILIDCVHGLAYIHSQFLVHGDVRASNVLISSTRTALITDFGLVGVTESLGSDFKTYTRESGGKAYMAPELHSPDKFNVPFRRTPKTDAYSFGNMVLEVYTGHPQFGDEREIKVMSDILSGIRPKRPTAQECGGTPMPDTWWDIAYTCLSTDAKKRPGTSKILEKVTGQQRSIPNPLNSAWLDSLGARWSSWLDSLT